MRGSPWRRKAADAPTVLRGVAPAKLAEPGDQARAARVAAPHRQLRRGQGARRRTPPTDQTDAWWNERQQLARDLLAAGRAADAYAVTVQHGQTKGIAFAEAEFLAGWIALRHLKKPAEA